MPWSTGDVSDFKEGLTDSQKEKWVAIANNVLEQCLEDDALSESKCEQAAIKQANGVVGNMKHINFRVNNDKVRREEVQGREYLVAPVVALKEGVLNYDDGNEFIPADEIKKAVNWWNGADLPIGHPKQRGQPISAKNKVVVDKNAVGRMWNAHYEDKKLKGELWIDIEKAQNMGGQAENVINKLESGEPIDVSTAYKRKLEQDAGEYDGQNYDGIQRNLRPDHLALLPNAMGNQSWSDGVGTPRLNEAGEYTRLNVRSTARTPSYSGTTEGEWDAPTLGDFGFDSVDGMSDSEITDVAEHSLLGEADADTFNEMLVLPVVDANGNLSKNALANAKARANQVSGISSDTVDSVKSKCTQLLEDEFDVETEENDAENIANKVFNKFKNYLRGDDAMSDLETVVDNTGFEADDLEEMSEDKISEWADAYNEEPDEEPEEEEETVENEEGDEPEGETVEDHISNEKKEELYQEFEERKENEEIVGEILDLSDKFEEDELLDNELTLNKKIKEGLEEQKSEVENYIGRNVPSTDKSGMSEDMEEFLGV